MKPLNIFFASNGHGEDIIACQIIKELREKMPFLSFKSLPLTGEGGAYVSNQVMVLGSRKIMPSGGFVRLGLKYLLKDIKAGLLDLFIEQIRILRSDGRKSDFVIAVGDTFLCSLCGIFTGKKIIFVSTAQSVYIGEFLWIDKWFMRHYARVVFPRDEKTASNLRMFGIPAVYFGNVMMDCLEITGEDFGIPATKKVVGLLPGSRDEAYGNFQYILGAVEEISAGSQKKDYGLPAFLMAIAPSIKIEIIEKIGQDSDWEFRKTKPEESSRGIIGFLIKPLTTLKGIHSQIIISNKFADVINNADTIIGLSGTGNEQAVGLGKPVVAFSGKGPQMTLPFLRDQNKLLGGMVFIVPRDRKMIAQRIFSILDDPSIGENARKIGFERMGPAGAADRISSYIKENILQNTNV